jgi:ATP-dependent Clp protease ATP-binding subunit ClpA
MFERFTREARDVVVQAQEAARGLGHESIEAEHLLLGLMAVGRAAEVLADLEVDAERASEEVGARVAGRAAPDAEALAAVGIDLDAVRERVEEAFGPGALEGTRAMRRRRRGGRAGSMPFAAPAKRVLEASLREALARRDNAIRAEHLLLAAVREPGVEAVLRDQAVTPDEVRARFDRPRG